ncbi:unnamed protein product [Trichogramma brassicae]|uniref:Uncharacterized protein n=1 Tax=Trichogramma brassicae TaxID=86971 RepID=A0A6H5J5V8_9HYME|nr:unnamed protein product [Trichogramma brassicae]
MRRRARPATPWASTSAVEPLDASNPSIGWWPCVRSTFTPTARPNSSRARASSPRSPLSVTRMQRAWPRAAPRGCDYAIVANIYSVSKKFNLKKIDDYVYVVGKTKKMTNPCDQELLKQYNLHGASVFYFEKTYHQKHLVHFFSISKKSKRPYHIVAHGKSVNLTTFRCNLEKIRRKRDSQNVTYNRFDE